MFYVGIDQHRKQLTVSVRNDSGNVVLRRQVSTQWDNNRVIATHFGGSLNRVSATHFLGGDSQWEVPPISLAVWVV